MTDRTAYDDFRAKFERKKQAGNPPTVFGYLFEAVCAEEPDTGQETVQ